MTIEQFNKIGCPFMEKYNHPMPGPARNIGRFGMMMIYGFEEPSYYIRKRQAD